MAESYGIYTATWKTSTSRCNSDLYQTVPRPKSYPNHFGQGTHWRSLISTDALPNNAPSRQGQRQHHPFPRLCPISFLILYHSKQGITEPVLHTLHLYIYIYIYIYDAVLRSPGPPSNVYTVYYSVPAGQSPEELHTQLHKHPVQLDSSPQLPPLCATKSFPGVQAFQQDLARPKLKKNNVQYWR